MTSDLWLRDLWLFGLQTAVVVSAAALVVRVCRLQSPRALLAYWRTVLLVVLMLPICQTWVPAAEPSRPRPPAAVAPAPLPDVVPATAPHTPTTTRWPAASRVLVLLGSGVLLRGLWMIAGVISLRRLRIDARPLDPVPASVAEIQSRLATKATFLLTGDATGPMTYGVLRPVVFLPQRVAALPDHVLQAVAAHELIDVRRRDWVEEVFIEGVVTLLWFHPGVRWLAGRIRLSREHVVDDEVIRRTASRERYADALLRVSLDRRRHGLLPAPAFHRQSALKQRLAHILQETAMTRRRIVASLTAGAAVVGLTALIVTRAFPLQAQVPDATGQASAAPVQVVKGGDHLLHGELPEYPARAVAQHVEGDVALDFFVDERGEVSDARVSSGPEELRRAALSSVLRGTTRRQRSAMRRRRLCCASGCPRRESRPRRRWNLSCACTRCAKATRSASQLERAPTRNRRPSRSSSIRSKRCAALWRATRRATASVSS